MAISKKKARALICIAVASQLKDARAVDLIKEREAGNPVNYDNLGIDREGRSVFVHPLNVVFKNLPLRWSGPEVKNLVSIEATENKAIVKDKRRLGEVK